MPLPQVTGFQYLRYIYIIKKQKIILIGPAYPLRGGIANFNEGLARALQQAGHDVLIVSFTLQYPSFLFPGTSQEAGSDAPPGGLTIVPMINSVNPLSWFRTAAFIRKQSTSKVIIRYWLPFMAPALGTIARLIGKGIRITALADNIIPHEKRFGDRALTRYFVNACDSFVVMSKSVLEDLKQFDEKKPVVMKPHPVYDIFGAPLPREEARDQLGIDKQLRLVLFFGFIRKYKGLDLLLQAFADERVRRLGVKLLVAGEFYEDPTPYREIVRTAGIEDAVIWHDHYIPKEKVHYYFSACNLVAQPYRDATQSGVTQIAYHFGRPMIVTSVGGLPEIVPHGVAGFVTDTTPDSIAGAIAEYFEKNLEATFITGVQQKAKEFSWEEFVRVFE